MPYLGELKLIYRPRYLLANVAIAVIYFLVIRELLSIQQKGVAITTVPVPLVFLLAITSSVTLTIAIYSISNTRRNLAKVSASGVSSLSVLVGGVLAGCSCYGAFLTAILAIFINVSEAAYINSVVASYSTPVFAAMIVINVLVALYYLNKLSKPQCKLRTRGR